MDFFFFCPKIAVKNKLPAISFGIESGTPLSLKCGFSLTVELPTLEQGFGSKETWLMDVVGYLITL